MEYHGSKEDEGPSNSLVHLAPLKLPDLTGKSFLDLGSRDGFFCQHALSQGAARVVGVETSTEYIEQAKARMPEVQFVKANLDAFSTKEKFDVILMRSAFHHSKEPSILLKKIYNLLKPNGVFIFEGPVFAEDHSCLWVPNTQAAPVFWYPTKKLWETVLLGDFNFRYMGRGGSHQNDAVPTEVYHCQKEMRSWTVISGLSKEGKSSYARTFDTGNIILHIDWLLDSSIANSMSKGDAIIDELSRRLKKTKDIGKSVRWIDTDEKAAAIAKHILRHLPTECDLVIEGYLFSNELFLKHFKSDATAQGVRLWHSEKVPLQ